MSTQSQAIAGEPLRVQHMRVVRAVRARSKATMDTTRRTVVWVAQDRLLRKLVLLVWDAHLLLHLLWAMLIEVAEDEPVLLS